MLNIPSKYYVWVVCLFVGCVIGACGDGSGGDTPDDPNHTGDPNHPNDQDPPDNDDVTALPDGVVLDSWGIADFWYAYDINTHKVTPGDASWIVREDNGDAFFVLVEGYYSDEGESGFPRMSVRKWEGSAFGEPSEMVAPHSVRDQPICFSIQPAAPVSCDASYDIIWRTDRRAIPDAEMAIDNPSLYIRSDEHTRVYQSTIRTPPTELPTDDSTTFARVPTIFDGDVDPVVDMQWMNQDVSVFQMLATIDVAQWQLLRSEDNQQLTIRARCVVAGYKPEKTDALEGNAKELVLHVDDLAPWTFIDLCGGSLIDGGAPEESLPRVASLQDTLKVGQWPKNYTFAFVLQKSGDDVKLWLAPDQPAHIEDCGNSENADRDASMWGEQCVPMDETVAVPPGLWLETE